VAGSSIATTQRFKGAIRGRLNRDEPVPAEALAAVTFVAGRGPEMSCASTASINPRPRLEPEDLRGHVGAGLYDCMAKMARRSN
jgi:hypothetical protein